MRTVRKTFPATFDLDPHDPDLDRRERVKQIAADAMFATLTDDSERPRTKHVNVERDTPINIVTIEC